MNTIREIQQINEQELARGMAGTSASWHEKFAQSAWIYVGNLDYGLTEGDVLCVLSQWGEIEDLSLVREESTGKSKGFCFCKYEDARSCVLAVDNFCGIQVLGRSLRVDHVENYRLPRDLMEKEEAARTAEPGHAYQDKELENDYNLNKGQDLFAAPNQNATVHDEKGEQRKRTRDKERQAKQARKAERARIRADRQERRDNKKKHRQDDVEEERHRRRHDSSDDDA